MARIPCSRSSRLRPTDVQLLIDRSPRAFENLTFVDVPTLGYSDRPGSETMALKLIASDRLHDLSIAKCRTTSRVRQRVSMVLLLDVELEKLDALARTMRRGPGPARPKRRPDGHRADRARLVRPTAQVVDDEQPEDERRRRGVVNIRAIARRSPVVPK